MAGIFYKNVFLREFVTYVVTYILGRYITGTIKISPDNRHIYISKGEVLYDNKRRERI